MYQSFEFLHQAEIFQVERCVSLLPRNPSIADDRSVKAICLHHGDFTNSNKVSYGRVAPQVLIIDPHLMHSFR